MVWVFPHQLAQGQEAPLVSVLMMSYNHEAFIEKAIRSVLGQVCDFPFEIVVGDDASTDGTVRKARVLQDEHPGIIRILLADKTQGVTGNFIRTLDACRGTYVAMLEGDDYWIDSLKMQSQADQLEQDTTLSLSVGRTRNRTFHGSIKGRYAQVDLLRRYLFHTSTLVFRRADMDGFLIRPDVLALDTLLIAHLMTYGDCGCIDREVSYYRRHEGGAWNGLSCRRQILNTQHVTNVLSEQFSGRYDSELRDRELWVYGMMMQIDLNQSVMNQWVSRWPLMKPLVCRTSYFHLVGSLRLMVRLLVLPIHVGILRLRRSLEIGSRIRNRLISIKSGSAKAGEL